MTNKPATPLPWELDDEAQVCAGNKVVAYPPLSTKADRADADAAYIAHACNAYPELVRRAQIFHAMMGWIAERCSASDMLLYERAIEEFKATDTLLNELKETA